MHTRTKLLLAGFAATLLMNVAASSASGNRLSFTNPNLFRVTWSRIVLSAPEGEPLIECPVTLEGSFHSATMRKVRGALIGLISRASVRGASCTGGSVTVLQATLPWHITYDSFGGTLPRLSSISFQLHGAGAIVNCIGVLCLYGDDGNSPARARLSVEPNGLATTIEIDTAIRYPLISGNFFCPEEAGYAGIGRVTALPGGGNIMVRLI